MYTIGGSVTGLSTGSSVVLQDGAGGTTSVSANGPFTFPSSVASGSVYAVSVSTQPMSQFCSLSQGSGTVTGMVSDVGISCVTSFGIASDYTVIYSLEKGSTGVRTEQIQGKDGNLYGTTGDGLGGTVFMVTPAGIETILHSFGTGSDGQVPFQLIEGRDQHFYGVTSAGGTNGTGTVFKF